MSKEVMQQALEALEHCQDVIIERGLGGNAEFAEMWGLQLPLDRAGHAIEALRRAILQTAIKEQKPSIVNPEDVVVETYTVTRGGFALHPQSGVRLTHKPTGTVVQCDAERSLHRNRETAWKDLEKILSETTPVPEPAHVTYKEVAEVMNSLWAGTTRDVQIAQVLATKKLYIDPPAQPAPVQEPVAWFWFDDLVDEWKHLADNQADADKYLPHKVVPLYTTPPAAQRQWVGLTEDEQDELVYGVYDLRTRMELAIGIEAKLKEKNS
jgi:hypothetical protein